MLPKLNCPYCGHFAMSGLKKSFLGPARSVTCEACGQRVSVPWVSMALMLPFLIGMIVLLPMIADFPVKIGVIAGIGILASLAQIYFVPLERR